MRKINLFMCCILSVFYIMLVNVFGEVAYMSYEIRYHSGNMDVLKIKKQTENTYYELVKGVADDSILDVVVNGEALFYFEGVKDVDVKNNVLIITLDESAILKIKGNFYDKCNQNFEKKSLVKEFIEGLN